MYYFINVKIFSVVTNKISQQQRANTPPPSPSIILIEIIPPQPEIQL